MSSVFEGDLLEGLVVFFDNLIWWKDIRATYIFWSSSALAFKTKEGREAGWIFGASGADTTMGSCETSIHPLAQSTLGWYAANQGYPRMSW